MAGIFSKSSRPKRPGAFFNFVAAEQQPILENTSGVVAIPFVHDWAIAGGWVAFALGAYALVVATLNLLLDMNAIEHDAARAAPKYMEWYGALSLLVTLVWIYLELVSHLGDDD